MDEHREMLTALARAEHGELMVDAVYLPGVRQLTAVLVGGERVAYAPDGLRLDLPSYRRRVWRARLLASIRGALRPRN